MSCFRVPSRGVFAALMIALLVVLPLVGPTPSAVADEEVTLRFGEEAVPMEDFLRAVSKTTHQTLVWNPMDRSIKGKKLLGGLSLSAPPDEFMDAVRSLLTFYDLVMIPVGPKDHERLVVVDARQTTGILRLKAEYVKLTEKNLARFEGMDGLFITTTIRVQHIRDLRSLRNALTRLVTGQNIGNVTEVAAADAVVVTDFAPNVVAIYRLVRQMDVPSAASSTTGTETKAFVLEHAKATETVALLMNQFGQPAEATGARRAPQQSVAGPSAPRIAADVRTNRILVTGLPDEVDKVKATIDLLDVPVMQPDISMTVVPLKHIRSNEAASTLMTLIRSTPALWHEDKSRVPAVVSHGQTNALLVSGTTEATASILGLIESLDVERK